MSIKYIDNIKQLIEVESNIHAVVDKITLEFIESTYATVRKKIRVIEKLMVSPPVDEDTLLAYFITAKKEYLSIHPISIEVSSSLTKEGFQTWLTNEREQKINWHYTERYLNYLEIIGRSKSVIGETDRSSREIIGKLGDPEDTAAFYTKGLVVGEVQSGKTSNFNAVINRAMDSGYQLIIVLSGIMEDLRSQTQNRIELEVVGEGRNADSHQIGIKGVGEIRRFGLLGDQTVDQLESITSEDVDFNTALLRAHNSLNTQKILVCKKNVSVLRNLIIWLHDLLPTGEEAHGIPLLVIDDEADNASLNNEGAKGRDYASKINGHIRTILKMFHKQSYLGYTASPFANVLQDRNDEPNTLWIVKYGDDERELAQVSNLFPDDFIVLLDSPTNYIGAKQIFETISVHPKLPVVYAVSDHIESFPSRVMKNSGIGVENYSTISEWNEKVGLYGHYLEFSSFREYRRETRASRRDDSFPSVLPKSLKDAVLCFILTIAVRESRKASQRNSTLFHPHNSMLVHVSRFTTWQNTTTKLVDDYLKNVKARVENDAPDITGSIYFQFEDIWNLFFADIVDNIREYLREGYEDGFMVPIIFDALVRYIPAAIEDIDVLAINSTTEHKLVYSKRIPRKIIAVGGNRLSRGFTLEGLTINYFVRTTNYSDTLLQMGRWFGYRPGYLDCCRVFTTRDSIEKFNSTTRCIEELENDFKKMDSQSKSPANFLLKVRKDPGVLKITRPSILKNTATVKWSYQDQLEMTTKFDIRKQKIERVWDAFRNKIAPMFSKDGRGDESEFFTMELMGSKFLEFLKIENNYEASTLDAMSRFIELCQENDKLTDWTVAIKLKGDANSSMGKGVLKSSETGLPGEVNMVVRNGPEKNHDLRNLFIRDKVFRASGKSANIVSSPRDLSVQLDDRDIKEAEKEFRHDKRESLIRGGMSEIEAIGKVDKMTIPERVYREKIPEHKGLLIIYLFDSFYSFNQARKKPDERFEKFVNDGEYDLNIPIVGYAIGFPPIKDDPGGIYTHGDYDLKVDEDDDEGVENEDLSVPDDAADETP